MSKSAGKLDAVYSGRRIQYGDDDVFELHPNGDIVRPNISKVPSGDWRVVGAIEFSKHGWPKRRYSLLELLLNPEKIPWHWKNGRQRTCIIDLDHGSERTWVSPNHKVF